MEANLPQAVAGVKRKPVSLLQALPESGQLFLMGSGLFVIGVLVRLGRRLAVASKVSLQSSPKQSNTEPLRLKFNNPFSK